LMRIKRFQTTKNLHQCPSCKEYYTTERQLTWVEHRLGPNVITMPLCNKCKRSRTARMAAEISTTSGTGPKRTTF
jgi:ribosomal protein L37AE/L43A